MMMDARALPSELLDEKELHERFKAIDAAARRVRKDLESQLAKGAHKAVKVKLAIEKIAQTN